MTREEKLLFHLKRDGIGIDIGASHSPIAPKRNGFNVHVIDHATREQLVEKYKDDGVNLDNIEEVDFVWRGEEYSELTGKTGFYDWIIASHVIEHVPDFIGFLKSCEKILNDDGVLSLAVPDVRFCFDHFRPITSLSRMIDAHWREQKLHSPGSIAEFYRNFVLKDDMPGWGEFYYVPENFTFSFSKQEVLDRMRQSMENKEYVDCHAWCFTPHSFRLMIHDLFELGFIELNEVAFFDAEGCEFHIALRKNGAGSDLTRIEMLNRINEEMLKDLEPAVLLNAGWSRLKTKIRSRYGSFRAKSVDRLRSIKNQLTRFR